VKFWCESTRRLIDELTKLHRGVRTKSVESFKGHFRKQNTQSESPNRTTTTTTTESKDFNFAHHKFDLEYVGVFFYVHFRINPTEIRHNRLNIS
jgi:hypothetical protein